MGGAVRRAEKNQLSNIVLHALRAEHRGCHHPAAGIADAQAVRLGRAVDEIAGLLPAAARHILLDDGGIAGNVFLQQRHHRSNAQVARAAGVAPLNDPDSFAFIEIALAKRCGGRE